MDAGAHPVEPHKDTMAAALTRLARHRYSHRLIGLRAARRVHEEPEDGQRALVALARVALAQHGVVALVIVRANLAEERQRVQLQPCAHKRHRSLGELGVRRRQDLVIVRAEEHEQWPAGGDGGGGGGRGRGGGGRGDGVGVVGRRHRKVLREVRLGNDQRHVEPQRARGAEERADGLRGVGATIGKEDGRLLDGIDLIANELRRARIERLRGI